MLRAAYFRASCVKLGKRWLRAFACLLALLAFSVRAQCADTERSSRASARVLGYAGAEAYRRGDYVAAEQNFSQAFGLLQVPSLGLWSARSLVKLGRLVEGAERYRQVALLPAVRGEVEIQRKARSDALRDQQTLLPRIPLLRLELAGASAGEVELSIDGVAVREYSPRRPLRVNPGTRLVVGRRGTERQEAVVTAREGEQLLVKLGFAELPRDRLAQRRRLPPRALASADAGELPGYWRSVGWVGIGVGGAALALSGVVGLIANGKRSGFEDDCPQNACPRSIPQNVRDDVNTYNSLRTISTVGWITGGALAAGGLVLLLTEPGSAYPNSTQPVSVGLGPASLAVSGAF